MLIRLFIYFIWSITFKSYCEGTTHRLEDYIRGFPKGKHY